MDAKRKRYNTGYGCAVPDPSYRLLSPDHVKPGVLIELFGSVSRIVAIVDERVFASDLRTHHTYLIQDADGSIQLPPISTILAMIKEGQAALVRQVNPPSPTERMRVEIDMLDAAGVRQGEKAIWIFLTAHWTPALEAQFGPHDAPWKIRKWRAALRKAAKGRPAS